MKTFHLFINDFQRSYGTYHDKTIMPLRFKILIFLSWTFHFSKFLIIPFLFFFSSFIIQAQIFGGGEANPNLKTNQEALQKWQRLRFGMFIHWGPVTLRGTEIGWSRGTSVPVDDYDSLYKEFDPVLFNARDWVHIAKESGMKYIILVTKHHDGFCLWPSEYTDYDIASTPYGKDIVKQIADECKKQGILFGTYYSILDWWNPLYPGSHGKPPKDSAKTNMNKYIQYLYHEVDELVTKYNTNILWFDGQWEKPWTHEEGMKLYAHLRKLKNSLLINNRVDKGHHKKDGKYAGDFLTPEQKIGTFDLINPWESCITIGTQWSWKPNDKIKSTKELVKTLALTAGGNGNLLLNVGPMLDGRIEKRQIKRLQEVGAWLKKYGESIYGTTGGPYTPSENIASTRKKNFIYLHLLDTPGEKLVVPSPGKARIMAVRFLGGQKLTYNQNKKLLQISLPEKLPNPYDAVITLEINKPAENIAPINLSVKKNYP